MTIRASLPGGNPRTLRNTDAVAPLVLDDPERLDELNGSILDTDNDIVRHCRAARRDRRALRVGAEYSSTPRFLVFRAYPPRLPGPDFAPAFRRMRSPSTIRRGAHEVVVPRGVVEVGL